MLSKSEKKNSPEMKSSIFARRPSSSPQADNQLKQNKTALRIIFPKLLCHLNKSASLPQTDLKRWLEIKPAGAYN